ncbi:MAG: hypothetical protein J7J01_06530, partial [Methanophagales archaeon]|nr:hypothetical protein [Methanophagales archaeon]
CVGVNGCTYDMDAVSKFVNFLHILRFGSSLKGPSIIIPSSILINWCEGHTEVIHSLLYASIEEGIH